MPSSQARSLGRATAEPVMCSSVVISEIGTLRSMLQIASRTARVT